MKRISIIFIFALLVCSCVFDNFAPDDCPAGKTRLSLSMREMQVKETRSAATANECWISDAFIFVFDSNGKYKSGEVVSVENAVTGNGNTTPSIETSLPMADGDSIVVLCNTGMSYLPNLTKGVSTTNDINEEVVCLYPVINQEGADGGKCLPMSGIAEWNHATPPSISMYRSVAKFQLLINIPQGRDMTGEFTRDGVKWTMCHMPMESHVFSRNGELNVPEYNQYYDDLTMSKRAVGAAGASAGQLAYYVFEAENSTKAYSPSASHHLLQYYFDAARTCLIVETAAGFYRIDIAEGNTYDDTKRFLDIQRNFDYRVIVTSVKSNGYPTLEEALENPGSNLEYSVVIDGDEDNSITSNGQYAVATDRSVTSVTNDVTAPENLVKFSCYGVYDDRAPTDIMTRKVRLVGSDKKTNIPTNVIQLCKSDGTAVVGNEFTFTKDEEKDYQLSYTVGDDYPSDEEVYVEVCYGNIRHYVPVESYVFGLKSSIIFYNSLGSTESTSIISYKKFGQKVIPVPWKVSEYSLDEDVWQDKKPEFAAMSYSGKGGISEKLEVTLAPQEPQQKHNEILKSAPSPSGVYNLANQTDGGATVENTANCYVVNAPGVYSFPLVYGNAIKNGVDNPSSYKTSNSGDYILSNLIRHDGEPINSPWINSIYNSAPLALSVSLLWQDAKGLVDQLSMPDPHTVQFRVRRETITQGNAVIAVKDAGGQILWSWHIWVTDLKLSDSAIRVKKEDDEIAGFMQRNLGRVNEVYYPARYLYLRCAQEGTGKKTELTLYQIRATTSYDHNTYYQWGRKDPFIGMYQNTANKLLNVTWYDETGKVSIADPEVIAYDSFTSKDQRVRQFIQRPDLYMVGKVKDTYANLWNNLAKGVTRDEDTPVVKTVYDPCPVGYRVPLVSDFSGMRPSTGKYNATYSRNVWYFNPEEGDTMDLPIVYQRDYRSGAIDTFITRYWTSVPSTNPVQGGHVMQLYPGTSYYFNGNDLFMFTLGCTIRPVKENN